MADLGAWGAAATACAGAVATVIAAARQPADVATLRAEVKAAREELPAAIKGAVDAVRAAFEASIAEVKANGASVARRVGVLEDWRKNIHAQHEGRPPIASGNDLAAQVDRDHERRITALESEQRALDKTLTDSRMILARIEGNIQSAAERRGTR